MNVCNIAKTVISKSYSHKSLVVVSDLLDVDVVLAVDVGLRGGISVCNSYYASDVLEVIVIFYFHLKLLGKNVSFTVKMILRGMKT